MSGGNDEGLTPAQRQAAAELDGLIQQRADGFAIQHDELDDDEAPVGQQLLSEWTLVMAWTDEDGGTWITQACSPNMPSHHADGLLHRCLYE